MYQQQLVRLNDFISLNIFTIDNTLSIEGMSDLYTDRTNTKVQVIQTHFSDDSMTEVKANDKSDISYLSVKIQEVSDSHSAINIIIDDLTSQDNRTNSNDNSIVIKRIP